jgi:hypothetical protein
MKKLMLLLVGALISVGSFGQKSIIKTNLASWAVSAANLTYEYQAGPSLSVGLTTHLKFASTFDIDALAEQNDGEKFDWSGSLEAEGFVITPFVRLYTGDAMKGFYIELFARYYTYDFVIPYDYDKDGVNYREDGIGDADGFGGGVAFGTQIFLGPAVVLDIYAGLGFAGGNAHVETPDDSSLDAEDYADIAQSIEDNKSVDIFLFEKTLENVMPGSTNNKAFADVDGELFPILRGGIAIGYNF